jgi:PAS domain S-box-containing protein
VFLAALRLGPRGATLASFVVAVVAVSLAVGGVTPFETTSTALRVQGMQVLIVTMATSSLALAAAIVEQQSTAARLREAEERYRAVVESAPIGLVLAREDGTIAFANPAFLAIVGRTAREVVGQSFADFTHPDDRPSSVEAFGALSRRERERISFEKRFVRADGSVAETHLQAGILRDLQGRYLHSFAMIEDVTERRRLETQLLQSQKLDAVGRLAGGVAHDFNNVLTIILAQAALGARVATEPRVAASFADITDAARRAAGLTRQLLSFSRKQVVAPRVADLASLVVDVVRLLGSVIGENVVLRLEPRPPACPVRIDPSQLEQIVLNLAVNARDAMPDGGVLSIAVEPATVDGAAWTVLVLSDTGVGMDEAVRSHLFEPFFTTKERGKGTGLGLATVHAIVAQAGGRIEVDSAPGQGTTFRVWLPGVHGPADSSPPSSSAASGHGETVLVVEDEPAVRRVAVEMLRSAGYVVLEAADADAALSLARDHVGPIALLLTDVVMPGKSGRVLADELVRSRPEVRVLFTGSPRSTCMDWSSSTASGRWVSSRTPRRSRRARCRPRCSRRRWSA